MQAAGGASLNDAADHTDAPAGPGRAGRPRPAARWWLLAIAATAYAVDVASKVLAVDRLADGDVPLVGDFLVLHLTRNPGAAFSTGTQYTVVLTCIAIAAVCVVLVLALRVRDMVWAVALGLLLAGVGGNLTDRLLRAPGPFRGHVIDFFMLPNWPVFNVADICINLAAGLILVQAFRGVRLDGSRTDDEPDDDPADDAPKGAA